MKALVLLSGGLDSTATLARALVDADAVVALSLRYGSLHGARELIAATHVVKYYRDKGAKVDHVIRTLPDIFAGGKSALLGQVDMPDEEYHDPELESPSATVVPFRNANFIAAATTIAEIMEASRVYIGIHANDHVGWAYPDCSPEFIGAMAAAVYVGTMHKVRLVAPFVHATKRDIVTYAYEHRAPAHLTWSCYRGSDVHCGNCPTCRERIQAFQGAGFVDPVEYARPVHFDGVIW